MTAGILLSKLDGVKRTGQDSWICKCPAHGDRHASLSIRELDDGRVLLHCFAACEPSDILAALGLKFEDLFPNRTQHQHFKRVRRPFNAKDILLCVASESIVVILAASDIAKGNTLSIERYDRLILAASRIQRAAEVASDA